MKCCYSCFKRIPNHIEGYCPYCGEVLSDKPVEPIHLMCGTVLAKRYIVGRAVGSGGFGIVYKAFDTKLGVVVAIKEFYATRLVTRAEGLKNVIINKKNSHEFEYRKARFLAEARNMAKFGSHRSIPNVFEFFEENNTAYIVMEFLGGVSLNMYMRQTGGKIDVPFALMIANEVGKALNSLHENKIIHRDVAPDNIFICSGKEIKIKLMDLGAAKLEDSTDDVIDIILKPGYAPPEQYDATKNIGPWTDVYALGASLYVMLTGTKPDESTNRKIYDNLVPVNELNPDVSENLSNAIMKAMALEKHMRFKCVDDFLKAINGNKKVISLKKEKKKRKRNRFISVVAALMAVVVGVTSVVINYENKRKQAGYLESAEITVWYIGDEESLDLNNVFDMFSDTYKKDGTEIKINREAIPQEQYEERLIKALNSGNMPNLFESSGVDDDLLKGAMELDDVIDSDVFKECTILSKNYEDYYSSRKRMPMAVDIPVAIVITNGPKSLKYDGDYYNSTDDFSTNAIAKDEASALSWMYNFSSVDATDVKTYDRYAVVMTSTERLRTVDEVVSNAYPKKYVYPQQKSIECRFAFEWSVYGSSDEENADNEDRAALKLMEIMISPAYQDLVCVNRTPLYAEAIKPEKAEEYQPAKEIYSKIKIRK